MATPGTDTVNTWVWDPVTEAMIEVEVTYADLVLYSVIREALRGRK